MPLRLPEIGFAARLVEVRIEAASLIRLSRQPATEPFWSRGRYRFDGPTDGAASFGTCYAAQSLEVAFCESVLHETAWFQDGRYEVPASVLRSRHLVRLARPQAPSLRIADLTGAALKALGLNNDLSAGDDYRLPMAWARAIHAAGPHWDGIRHVSRQHNAGMALAIFERSRVVKAGSRPLAGRVLDALCDAFGVVAV